MARRSSLGERVAMCVATVALASGLWVALSPARGYILVAALIASGLFVASVVWLIVGLVNKGKDDESDEPRAAYIKATGGRGLSIRRNYFSGDRSALDAEDVEGIDFDRNIVGPSQQEASPTRRSWSFPEMPWKKKRDDPQPK